MKFLLDVHISTRIARAINDLGHEIVRAALDYPTWTDEDLLALARKNDWIIVSEDSDFTDLVFAFGALAPPSLIYIRCEPDAQPLIVDRVSEVIAEDRLIGNLVVVTQKNARYRPFPKTDN